MAKLREDSSHEIYGEVKPGFEPVLDQFEDNFKNGLETTAQCCAYVGTEKVVDIYGKLKQKVYSDYNADSLSVIFSSSKSITSIIFATLVDKGLVSYENTIGSVWPEFSQNGKENITIENVLRHESGLARINWDIPKDAFLTENIKKNVLGKVIEQEKQRFPDPKHQTDRQYHAISRGFILNEIFRRVEPNGRTIGEVLREDFAKPQNLDVHMGIKDQEKKRLRKLDTWNLWYVYYQHLLPDWLGSKVEHRTVGYFGAINRVYKLSSKPRKFFSWETPEIKLQDFSIWTEDFVTQGEMPSSTAICSARGLAKLAAAMANKGQLGDLRLMSASTWDKMHGAPIVKKDVAQNIPGLSPTIMTRGGLNFFKEMDDEDHVSTSVRSLREGYFGWYGLGGSVFQWHPELKIGFAYIPTLMAWYDPHNIRGAKLQKKVAECAKAALGIPEDMPVISKPLDPIQNATA